MSMLNGLELKTLLETLSVMSRCARTSVFTLSEENLVSLTMSVQKKCKNCFRSRKL